MLQKEALDFVAFKTAGTSGTFVTPRIPRQRHQLNERLIKTEDNDNPIVVNNRGVLAYITVLLLNFGIVINHQR